MNTGPRPDPLDHPDEELRFHLERQVEELVAAGWDHSAAEAEARRRFGDPDRVLATLEDMGRRRRRMEQGSAWLGELGRDVAFALRQIRRRPLFAVAAVAVIALGIGIAGAVFAVVDAAWLRPLPFPQPEQLVVFDDREEGMSGSAFPASLPEYRDWEREGAFLAASAAIVVNDRTLIAGDQPERVQVALLWGDLDGLTRLPPIVGRAFTREESSGRKGPSVLLLDEDFWRARFAADPGVVGRTVDVDGKPTEIVGVLPRSVKLLYRRTDVQTWQPLPDVPMLNRGLHLLTVVGRLRPEVDVEVGKQRTLAMSAALRASGVSKHDVTLDPLRDRVFGDSRRTVLSLTLAVGLALAVACINLAHLFLTRGSARAREFAVRRALGAGRLRLARQLLTEALCVAALGAAGGVALSHALTGWLARASGNDVLAHLTDGRGPRVVAFALLGSLLVGAVFGWLPALRAGSGGLGLELQGGRDLGASGERARLRRVLVMSEVALCAVLLVGAGLLVRTVSHLVHQDLGYEPNGVLTAQLTLPYGRYSKVEAQLAFWEQLLQRVRALPGVRVAGFGSNLPLLGDTNGGFEIVGHPTPEDSMPHSKKLFVGPGFFDAMGIRFVRGRDIQASDRRGGPEVAVISASLARRYWPSEDPIGKRIRFLWQTEAEQEIVGIVSDERRDALQTEGEGAIYLSTEQIPNASLALAVRTDGSPSALAQPIRAIVHDLDPQLALFDVQTLDAIVRRSVTDRRALMQLLALFGGLALLLAGVGVYAVAAQAVLARRREIGLRLAIGASPRTVLRGVLQHEAIPVLFGLVLGLAAAVPASRLLAALLYEVAPTDPLTLGAVALALLAAAGVALVGPALRAVRVDPATALRSE